MKTYDVAIIGAGPAGIMAAIFASEKGKRVCLIDKNEIIGRKILATGNGRCNITNLHITSDNYHGANRKFVNSIISQFNQNKTISFFQNLGLVLKEENNGRIFPRNDQAKSVVEILASKLNDNNVELMLGQAVLDIRVQNSTFILNIGGKQVESKKIIIATGGKAAHHLGSSGDGLYWAKKLGHNITPIYAALVPVETVESWPKQIQGLKITAKVQVATSDKKISEKTGDLLFTHFGVSGPAIMAQSGIIAPFLGKEEVKLKIDTAPDLDEIALEKILIRNLAGNGAKQVKNALVGLMPNNLIDIILKFANVDLKKKSAEISKVERQRILQSIKNLTLTIKELRPLKEAQVTSGGINADEIDSCSLESRIIENLYFAGEVVDVHGDSGGFNLQWAWSSGYVAGSNVVR